MGKVRVLVVDDSSVVRQVLSKELNKDPEIEVIGTAPDAFSARDKLVALRPDVMTLDVEMPRMDGITFLRKLMERFPLPVIIVSAVTHQGCRLSMEALEIGAVDVVAKPQINNDAALAEFGIRLCDQVKAAAQVRFTNAPRQAPEPAPAHSAPPGVKGEAAHKALPRMGRRSGKIIAIGASTGGTEALKTVLEQMPPDCPPIMIVQHMPGSFTKAFSERLNRHCAIEVLEAENGMEAKIGRAIIANGNLHLVLRRGQLGWVAETRDGPLVCRHRPSVEVLFNSFAKVAGAHALGAILTGMGRDGADAMKVMRDAGAHTVAQDEKTCVVFGMPKEAIKAGGAEKTLPLTQIAPHLVSMA